MGPRRRARHMRRKSLAGRDADLLLYQVATVNFLCDGVLNLDACVHFHEIKTAIIID